MMERFDCHFMDITMETRTFRIVPVERGSEIEVIDILDKQPRQNNHRSDFECEDDDDSLVIAAPAGSNTSSTDNRSLRERMELLDRNANRNDSRSVDTMDSRDDEASLPMVLRAYNRKDHRSPRVQQVLAHHQQHQKAPTETEKRIAQLRSAGLSISTKSLPPLSSPRIGDQGFRSPRYKKEERQAPLSVPFDPIFTGFRTNGLASNNCSPLQALLEKDKHRQRGKISPPPRSIRARLSAIAPKTPPPRLHHELADPIIAARPAYKGMRVTQKEYPDPEAFGWTFVGSCGERRVEFFEKESSEKGLVILEFHYTTGTVKATLEHPLWGESLLAFAQGGSKVSLAPRIYRKILLDPLGCSSMNASRGSTSFST